MPKQHRIERTYPTTAEKVWDLWTTPEGFTVRLLAGRANELDNLATLIESRR